MNWDTPTVDAWTTGASSRTPSHTVGAGTNRLLIAVIYGGGAGLTVSAAPTYNGVSMTQIGVFNATPIFANLYLYKLVAPASGSNTFSVSFSASGTGTIVLASCDGVDQTTPNDAMDTDTVFNTTTTPSAITVSAIGDTVLNFLATGGSVTAGFSGTPGALETELADSLNLATGNEHALIVSRKDATGVSLTSSYTLNQAVSGYYVQLNINTDSPPPPPPNYDQRRGRANRRPAPYRPGGIR